MNVKNLKSVIIFSLILLGISISNSQEKVTGTVVDNLGIPLPGVSVILEGTTSGSDTNFDGIYTVNGNFIQNSVLIFSYVGFKTLKIPVAGRTVIDIQMEEDINALNEVVIVGYGSQQKKDITGSVSTIDGETFDSRPTTQVGALIQGQSAGVQVLANSGKPSEGFNIRIRGVNSITAGSDPLYVVDGVPTTDTRSINPSDIDTITILKDASSTAIYGAQGANGGCNYHHKKRYNV